MPNFDREALRFKRFVCSVLKKNLIKMLLTTRGYNLEIAVMSRGQPMRMMNLDEEELCPSHYYWPPQIFQGFESLQH